MRTSQTRDGDKGVPFVRLWQTEVAAGSSVRGRWQRPPLWAMLVLLAGALGILTIRLTPPAVEQRQPDTTSKAQPRKTVAASFRFVAMEGAGPLPPAWERLIALTSGGTLAVTVGSTDRADIVVNFTAQQVVTGRPALVVDGSPVLRGLSADVLAVWGADVDSSTAPSGGYVPLIVTETGRPVLAGKAAGSGGWAKFRWNIDPLRTSGAQPSAAALLVVLRQAEVLAESGLRGTRSALAAPHREPVAEGFQIQLLLAGAEALVGIAAILLRSA